MTSFNREKFIGEAIESVLCQNYSNFELIILDDCSNDNTFPVAVKYSMLDKRIRVYRNDLNIGQFSNRNKISRYAQKEIIMYLDSDDTLKQDALNYIANCFTNYPNISFTSIYNYGDLIQPRYLDSSSAINMHFFEQSILHIGPSGTAISNKLFFDIGGFPIEYGPAGDVFYNLKVASKSGVLLLPYNYLNYRRHDGQELNNHFSYLYNGYLYFKDILNYPGLPLTKNEKSFLALKNKRRFVVNSLKYLIEYKDIAKISKAYKLANFGFFDFIRAIFH